MKVLIVEDQSAKLARITAILRECGLSVEHDVEYTGDVNTARSRMLLERYDLLILDIALPHAADSVVRADAGLDLLDEVIKRPQYKTPQHILGLTGNTEALAIAREKFDEEMLTLAWYEPSQAEWGERLGRKVRQLISAERALRSDPVNFSSRIAIVCALEDELDGLLRIREWNWQVHEEPRDASIYHRGEIEKNGRQHVVFAGAVSRMGMPAAAVLSTKMIHHFRPQYLAMTGVTAGMRDDTQLGDVIAADPCWDGGSGKWVNRGGVPHFLPAPHQITMATDLVYKLRRLKLDRALLDEIRSEWPAAQPQVPLSVHIGPVASGAAVLADGGTRDRLRDQNRKLLGIEMETYGMYIAAAEATTPRPLPFSMKAVVDFADGAKDDRFREYSIYTSSQVFRHFVERYLL